MIISRRGLVSGLVSFVAAPAIVRVESLMPVRALDPAWLPPVYLEDAALTYRIVYLRRWVADQELAYGLAKLGKTDSGHERA